LTAWRITESLIKKYTENLLTGTVLAIDPASGGSSMPGYAVYKGGQLVQSGTIAVKPHLMLNVRLRLIADVLRNELPVPDVFVIEDIRRIRGIFSGASVDILFKGIGAIMSAVTCDKFIEIPPTVWTKTVEANYKTTRKSDEQDAIEIGRFAIEYAQEYRSRLKNKGTEDETPRKAPSTRKTNICRVPKSPKARKPRKVKISSSSFRASRSPAPSKRRRSKK